MPREAQGPRLWFRKPRKAKGKRPPEAGGWLIVDGTGKDRTQHRTSCGLGDRGGAERALAEYLATKHATHDVPRRQRRLAEIPIADVLNLYAQDVVPGLATAEKAAARVGRLIKWWGTMKLDEVTGAACRQFSATRTPGGARRELQDLQAAIGHHHKEGLHRELVRVTLPPAGRPRERWLTRSEVARLLRVCLHTPEIQEGQPTDKRPLRHLARFILFAIYTGSRPGDVLNAGFFVASDRGVIDLDSGLYFRRPAGKLETSKRQPTTPLDARLMAHLRRWRELGATFVVEHGRERMLSAKVGFARAVELAGLGDDVVPYTMRHTAATWMKQRGVPSWDVAGYLGTSEAMVEKHYGHHAPDHLRAAAHSLTTKPTKVARVERKRIEK